MVRIYRKSKKKKKREKSQKIYKANKKKTKNEDINFSFSDQHSASKICVALLVLKNLL